MNDRLFLSYLIRFSPLLDPCKVDMRVEMELKHFRN